MVVIVVVVRVVVVIVKVLILAVALVVVVIIVIVILIVKLRYAELKTSKPTLIFEHLPTFPYLTSQLWQVSMAKPLSLKAPPLFLSHTSADGL